MRIVSWNMNRRGTSAGHHQRAWEYLQNVLRPDVALVQEAEPPDEFTQRVYVPIDKARFNWGSAVVALHPDLRIQPRRRVALADSYLDAVAPDELPDSHPGACAVADVLNASNERLLTAISLYGQWEMTPGGNDMFACARLHRMLSDLTGILATSRRHPVLIAGDLNVTTQFPRAKPSQAEKDAASAADAAFARMRAWGLADCLAATAAERPPLPHCTCLDGSACSHVQTFRSNNQIDSRPTQLDYVFGSASVFSKASRCTVDHSPAAWQLSDHCPLIVDFALQSH